MSNLILSLREIGPQDRPEAGGKAEGLARLASLGLPVPPAFAVTASFFEEVRARFPDEPELDALARKAPPELRRALDSALDALRDAPNGYAVRSSGADEDREGASFAGVHDSLLRVRREEVPAAIFRCWASAFSERALSYRRRMGLPAEIAAIRMGVLVQPMLEPSVAGVLFTREPGSPDGGILINATAGSGEDLAQGAIRPASIRVSRDDPSAAGEIPQGIPLPGDAIRDLSGMALAAEEAWGVPLDLEWALAGDRLFLLQARPITGSPPPGSLRGPERELPPAEDTLWSRANLRELLPELPSVFFNSLMGRVDWAGLYRRTGIAAGEGEIIRVIEGRPYFNLSLIGSMLETLGFSASRFARAVGHGSDVVGLPDREDHPFRALLRHPLLHLRLQRRQSRTPREALEFFDRVHVRVRSLRQEDPARLSDGDLLQRFRDLEEYNAEFLAFLMNGFNRVSSKMFAVELSFPSGKDLDRFVNAVVGKGEKNVSVRQGLDLLRLGKLARNEGRVLQYLVEGKNGYRDYEEELEGTRFLPAFRDYVAEYGHRGVQETDPSMPVYAEDPAFLLKAVGVAAEDPLSPDPESMSRRQEEVAAAAWKELRRGLPFLEKLVPIRLLLLRRTLRGLRSALALRERIRFEGMRVNAEFRRFIREAGKRLQARGLLENHEDLFLLRIEEVEAVLAGREAGKELGETVRRRREEREREKGIAMPNFLRESEIPGLGERQPIDPLEEGTFLGLPVGPGRVEGRVVVLEGPHQVDRIRRGDILVAPTLDPSWIPLFTLASGLVVEMGGTLSHGSIIAREYGLPTVVNLPGITRKLRSGDRILLDGGAGTIQRLGG